jgi:transcriptional regulator GlxA family with amidase domain
VLDFAGPYEVFNVTGELNDPAPFNVFTVAESSAPIRTRGQMSINPNYSITNMPPADILIIPGGYGTRALLKKPHLLDWVEEQAQRVEYLLSVCTGALVLAQAGLLDGMTVTTHHDNLGDLERIVQGRAQVGDEKRYYDNGKILTAGGVAAGIDLSLYVVRNLLGDEVLRKTLAEMEYAWTPATNLLWTDAIQKLS